MMTSNGWTIRIAVMLAILVSSACAKDGQMQAYTITAVPTRASVAVEMATPSDWTARDVNGDVEFAIPGVAGGMIALAALEEKASAEDRLKDAIKAQYDNAEGAERTDLPDGRVWMQRHEARVDHVRMFVPYAHGVVVAVAMVRHEYAANIPAIRKVFETLKVAISPRP